MFWKVQGYSTPSPIEQILDKEEFTLEELLDEDDIIQECKSLNGRLVAFLREKSTVEQLVRYLVEPAQDSDDPKRCYKYPFTSCEVFCCEVEAIFNTLLEDADLMKLLFSLLDSPAPLNCKTAGYFGRVVGNLLLRKTNEMMQYLQDEPVILEKLIIHVDTTSIADIIKRLVGAEEQSSMLFLPAYAQWLSETQLVELLLNRLAQNDSSEAQANAADILSAIAHTQPSPLAAKLTKEESVNSLFDHAMAPGKQVLVPALDVCIALVEPRRSSQEPLAEGSLIQETSYKAKLSAVAAIVGHVPKLVELLQTEDTRTQETPYGLLSPPLGRARLKVVELFAVLIRSGDASSEAPIVQSRAVPLCLQLFAKYPFNNLLHHSIAAMLVAALTKASNILLDHLFQECSLLDWLVSLPIDIKPMPRPGNEEAAAAKTPLRAGYLGHVTQIAATLETVAQASVSQGGAEPGPSAYINSRLDQHQGWQAYLNEYLHPRQELENTAKWACGRPAATELAGLDSDGDEYQNDMDLEQMHGIQPALYHRYNVVDEGDEEEDDGQDDYKASAFSAQLIAESMGGMDLNDGQLVEENISEEIEKDAEGNKFESGIGSSRADGPTDDDEVLLATSDDDELPAEEAEANMADVTAEPETTFIHEEPGQHQANTGDSDMVIVDEEIPEMMEGQAALQAGSKGDVSSWKPNWNMDMWEQNS